MKLGFVLFNSPGYSETFFRSKIKGLQENGVEVRLFCYNKKEDFELCPVVESRKVSHNKIIQGWRSIKEFVLLMPHLSRVIRYIGLERKEGTEWPEIFKKIYLNSNLLKANLDWLHFGFATMVLGSETVAKAIGAKMAVSLRGSDMAVYPVKNPDCYTLLWKYVDKVHAISLSLLVMAEKHGMPVSITSMKISPAIDTSVFKSFDPEFSPKDKPIFMTTGRLHWIKGYVPTLEALALLKAQGFDFIYKIVGEGEEYERIAFSAYQLGLKDRVQFLGRLPYSQVKKELEDADIYLQYSIHEGFCNSVLEAQSMGKLCIVSNGGGLSENVLHNQTGWVVPKYSPQLLAEQIKKVLLMDVQTKTTISKNALERVRREFNVEKQQQQFLEFYEIEGKD